MSSGIIKCFLSRLTHSIYNTVTRRTTTEKKRKFTSLLVSYQKCKKMWISALIIFERTCCFHDHSLYIVTQNLTFMGLCIVKIFHYMSNKMQRYTVYFIWKLFYMFRVVLPPIIRSANNYIYSIWYLSHRYCYLDVVHPRCVGVNLGA